MYGFYCAKCGANYSDKSRDLVYIANNTHKLTHGYHPNITRPCILNRTSYGTLTRPDLVEFLNAEHEKEKQGA